MMKLEKKLCNNSSPWGHWNLKVLVHFSAITGNNYSESSSINEGTVYYDVRFNAIAPENGEPITLIINLEIQTDDKPD